MGPATGLKETMKRLLGRISIINWMLFLQFVVLTAVCLGIDITRLSAGQVPGLGAWVWNGMIYDGFGYAFVFFIETVLGIAASVVFFIFVYKYNEIRKNKADKYLSSLILYTALYQGISRIFEIFSNLGLSDFQFLKEIVIKLYFPLDILGMVLFSIVVYKVFLEPRIEARRSRFFTRLLFLFVILGDYVGVTLSCFALIQDKSHPFIPIHVVIAFIVWGAILLILLAILRQVVLLRARITGPVERRKLLIMGFQVLLLGLIHAFLALSEAGDFIGLGWFEHNAFRILKLAGYLVIAVLYNLAFIGRKGEAEGKGEHG